MFHFEIFGLISSSFNQERIIPEIRVTQRSMKIFTPELITGWNMQNTLLKLVKLMSQKRNDEKLVATAYICCA